jgi:hypothetical protein
MEPRQVVLGFSINRILPRELKQSGIRINGSGGSHLFIEIAINLMTPSESPMNLLRSYDDNQLFNSCALDFTRQILARVLF